MLAIQQQHQQNVPESTSNNFNNFNNFRYQQQEQESCFLLDNSNRSQYLNNDNNNNEDPEFNFNNFEVANRAFHATIDKFTRQNSTERGSSPYSFLENWHLHNIYSKSQQTLLGITPIKPSVLLSGDDFMFTPPFIQEEFELLYQDDENEQQHAFYNGNYQQNNMVFEEDQDFMSDTYQGLYNIIPQSTVFSPQQEKMSSSASYPPLVASVSNADVPSSPTLLYFETQMTPIVPLNKLNLSIDNYNLSTSPESLCYNEQKEESTLHRVKSFIEDSYTLSPPEDPSDGSCYSSAEEEINSIISVNSDHSCYNGDNNNRTLSYQSLADIMIQQQQQLPSITTKKYGSIESVYIVARDVNTEELGVSPSQIPTSKFHGLYESLYIFIVYIWQWIIMRFTKSNNDSEEEQTKLLFP